MRKHKNIIIAGIVVVAILAAAWIFGGNYASRGGAAVTPTPTIAATATATPEVTETPAPATDDGGRLVIAPTPEPTPTPEPAEIAETATPEPTPEPEPTKDQYQTDPIPSGKPAPVEPQDATVGDGSFTVTLSVRCDTILDNLNLLDKNKHELVPADGIIFPATEVTVYEGESVFNVLQREMKRNKIHFEFMNTPIYNSAYIEGINNLYEFDVGELSGWMYKVNGWYPNYGCSRYQLKAGDVVEWNYTCDLGRDIGGEGATGGSQRDE
ncbi:MAG: DUF4430 domain-containing protein [Oscillospiraceae bacterium]|jgi:hypothetical protein|nr:DUF4430 domain-containing protein [Oscillospiraceae bacterium]